MHFFATVMVALGSIFSAVWIVVANSGQQTPAGFHIVGEGLDARAEITYFWALVLNPSSVHRLTHVLIGAFILGAFFVMSVSAFYLFKRRHEKFARHSFRLVLGLGLLPSLAAPISGYFQADTVAHTQPAKLAAFEGHFASSPADLYLFSVPDIEERKVKAGVAVPGGLSFLVHGRLDAPVPGLDAVPREDWPP